MDDNCIGNNADTTMENKREAETPMNNLYKSKLELPILTNPLESSITPLGNLVTKPSLFQTYLRKSNGIITTTIINNSISNYDVMSKTKKKVSFAQPFTIVDDIQSLKRYNLKMTYFEYDSVPSDNDKKSKCNCKIIRECVIM